MSELLYDLILQSARQWPDNEALVHKTSRLTYKTLADNLHTVAQGLLERGLAANERVAVYLPKQQETVNAIFGASLAGGVFVPVNPLLKPEQVEYILRDCNVRILITSADRALLLSEALANCHDLNHVVIVGPAPKGLPEIAGAEVFSWEALVSSASHRRLPARIDADLAAILYTSGSTGRPKGVVLSHRNMVAGARSVAQYLQNTPQDRLLAVLPFSFDYGLSQLTTAFSVGASVVLMDYLLPRDVVRAVATHGITGLAAVPPLWAQIAHLPWPEEAQASLRYLTNSGGAMPGSTLRALRAALPNTHPILMYGLTEAFRSTYLPVEELDRRPDSMGKAIPNAEVMVVREDGSPCAPGEPGELVHRGALVALGYWNDAERTAERFRPAPGQQAGMPLTEIAVWSGDTVQTDEEGFLYFVGRKDDMIKTSGYRVSPTEVEEVIYASGLVGHAAALGIPHPSLGQAIVAVVTPAAHAEHVDADALITACKKHLPAFMVPIQVQVQQNLPRNPNGKIDRKQLVSELQDLFQDGTP
ncbi:MAG: acyl-CoA ligase (AMP-forming), exosortase A system-associated [Gammaproteobacteria bacterium]|nr:acyl-CoA ligase (AMP-forming), exosortase A system-associated [Gammaproteobacteria bacterium]